MSKLSGVRLPDQRSAIRRDPEAAGAAVVRVGFDGQQGASRGEAHAGVANAVNRLARRKAGDCPGHFVLTSNKSGRLNSRSSREQPHAQPYPKQGVIPCLAMNGRGAVARAMAREGARVFIGGRRPEKLFIVAGEIRAQGRTIEACVVDVADEDATKAGVAAIASRTDGIDIAMNATEFLNDQGTAIDPLSLAAFMGAVTPARATALAQTRAANDLNQDPLSCAAWIARFLQARGVDRIFGLQEPAVDRAWSDDLGKRRRARSSPEARKAAPALGCKAHPAAIFDAIRAVADPDYIAVADGGDDQPLTARDDAERRRRGLP